MIEDIEVLKQKQSRSQKYIYIYIEKQYDEINTIDMSDNMDSD